MSIAVEDLDRAVRAYSTVLGREPTWLPPEHYAYPGLKGAEFHVGGVAITLITSQQPGTPIARFLKTKGEGVNHLSIEVSSIEETMRDLTDQGVELTTDKPLSYPEGRVIFAHPRSLHGVQIAFVEPNRREAPDQDEQPAGEDCPR